VQKEIIVIIGGPGTGKSTIIDGLIDKGFVVTQKFQSNLRGKKQGIEQLFSKSHYSANYFLKEEKNNSLMHRMNRMKLFLLTANS
jgi:predicted ATPase